MIDTEKNESKVNREEVIEKVVDEREENKIAVNQKSKPYNLYLIFELVFLPMTGVFMLLFTLLDVRVIYFSFIALSKALF